MEIGMEMETVLEAKRVMGTVMMQVYMKGIFDKLKIMDTSVGEDPISFPLL